MFLKSIALLALQHLLLLHPAASVTTKIVSSHARELGPEPCALVCSGTTGKKTTTWRKWDSNSIYTQVNTSDCGFAPGSIPTVTTTVSVAAISSQITGTAQVAYVGTHGFRIYLHGFVDKAGDLTAKYAIDRDYAVNWLAIGYNC
jgi:hypothetical protein